MSPAAEGCASLTPRAAPSRWAWDRAPYALPRNSRHRGSADNGCYDAACVAVQRHTVIADGGVKYSGDIVKAIAAGVGCRMIGSLFSRLRGEPWRKRDISGRQFKVYRGMALSAPWARVPKTAISRRRAKAGAGGRRGPRPIRDRCPTRCSSLWRLRSGALLRRARYRHPAVGGQVRAHHRRGP